MNTVSVICSVGDSVVRIGVHHDLLVYSATRFHHHVLISLKPKFLAQKEISLSEHLKI